MTGEETDKRWRKRQRWATCPEPYSQRIDAIASLWLEGAITVPEACTELDRLRQDLKDREEDLITKKHEDVLRTTGYATWYNVERLLQANDDAALVSYAIYVAQKTEQTTPEERLQCLTEIFRNLGRKPRDRDQQR